MKPILDIARKELRGSFESPVALLFLGAFLVAVLLSFFTLSTFFARGIADVRPLFEWLPLLLLVLVGAISMRGFAEERKMGTLEVLLTLPVPTWKVVLGKWLGGLALVALALGLTLPLPITVSLLGPLDWGPVVGGYVGALLLGGAYLALGLCISARTDNQVVALVGTVLAGGLLYVVGTDKVAGLVDAPLRGVLYAIGTGSRFASIERGVLDLRDLAWYVSLTAFLLALNVFFLERPRIDASEPQGRTRAGAWVLWTGLIGANVVALNAWLAPVTALRADLTANHVYSLHQATRDTLARLDEPLYIDGIFSSRTHPLLAPLVPQLEDLLQEYQVAGHGKVVVRTIDPTADEAVEQELGEDYGVRSFPFGVTDRNEKTVVNSFFHLLVRYGDQYQVLTFQDLIAVEGDPATGLDVRLRNPEYDITRAIRKVTQEFEDLDSLVAKLPEGSTLTLYATASAPKDFQEADATAARVGSEVADKADSLTFAQADPSEDAGLRADLQERFGIRPLPADLFGQHTFYSHLVLQAGDDEEALLVRAGSGEADLRQALEAAVRRVVPGQLHQVGLVTKTEQAPPQQPGMPPQTRIADYHAVAALLGEDYQVEDVDLSEGDVPDRFDVLIVGKTGPLDPKARWALDQYLMRGGSVIALAGAWDATADRGGLRVQKADPALDDLVGKWGVKVDDALVADPQNSPFPIPVKEQRGPFVFQRVEMVPYPFFPDVRADGFAPGHPALSTLTNVTMPWSSPLEAEIPPDGVEATTLLQTSEGSWLERGGNIQPDFAKWPDAGFGPSGDTARRTVAVALTGTIPSAFSGGEPPVDDVAGKLDAALPGARLVVLGSSEVISDLMMQVARQMGGEVHESDLDLVANLVDWSMEDTDLLEIRAATRTARTLAPLTEEEARDWEIANYAFALLALALVATLPRRRRKAVRPLALVLQEEA